MPDVVLCFYDNVPELLQVNVIVELIVWTGTRSKYRFDVKLPVALFPLFVAVAEVTFQLSLYTVYEVDADVHVADEPV